MVMRAGLVVKEKEKESNVNKREVVLVWSKLAKKMKYVISKPYGMRREQEVHLQIRLGSPAT